MDEYDRLVRIKNVKKTVFRERKQCFKEKKVEERQGQLGMWNENKVRIIDIAEELSVSTATVSNVLHGKTKKISDATVRRVEKKLEERGYIPNMAATLLARNNSRIIGVIINDHEKYEGHVLEDPFISAAVNHLADEIEKNHYYMMIKKTRDISQIVRFSTMWNLDGMVVIGFCKADYQDLRELIRVPFVVYDGYFEKTAGISDIRIDDLDGGRQAGAYLKRMGHREVLCIADNEICMDLDRYRGLCEGLGQKADFLQIPMEKEKRKLFYEQQEEYIRRHTAVFAVSDYYAIDLMNFFLKKEIRIPQDISVIGFDGSREGLTVYPNLTSVWQDNEARARLALELLLKMMADSTFFESVCIPVQLIERESVKKR